MRPIYLNCSPDKTRIKRQVSGNRLNVNIDDFADGLTNIDVTRVVPSSLSISSQLDICDRDGNALPCDHTNRYRTLNGWCNNLNNPQYGKSVTPLIRFLSAKYDDGEFTLSCWVVVPFFRSVCTIKKPFQNIYSYVA